MQKIWTVLARVVGRLWGLVGHLSTLSWIYPGSVAFMGAWGTLVSLYISQAPVWLWLPLIAFTGCVLALLAIMCLILIDEIRSLDLTRNCELSEAIMFGAAGKWGLPPLGEQASLEQIGEALAKFHQLASEGKIKAWGRAHPIAVFQPIPPAYWTDHAVDLLDLGNSSKAKPLHIMDGSERHDVMVCRANFQKEWRR
jgi:hypothetical protein